MQIWTGWAKKPNLSVCFWLRSGVPREFLKPVGSFFKKGFFLFLTPSPGGLAFFMRTLDLCLNSLGTVAHWHTIAHFTPVEATGWALETLEAGKQQFFAVSSAKTMVSNPHFPAGTHTTVWAGEIATDKNWRGGSLSSPSCLFRGGFGRAHFRHFSGSPFAPSPLG